MRFSGGLLFYLIGVWVYLGLFGIVEPVSGQSTPGDLVSPTDSPGSCLTIAGALDTLPAIQAQVCRGKAEQYWQIDGTGRWQSGADTNYCLARKSSGSRALSVRLCIDALTLQLPPVDRQDVWAEGGISVKDEQAQSLQ